MFKWFWKLSIMNTLVRSLEKYKKEYKLGEKFNTDWKTKTEEDLDLFETIEKRIYIPATIWYDGAWYYIVNKEDILVYKGLRDKEGAYGTIRKDIITLDLLINLIIAVTLKDKKKINSYCNAKDITKIMNQIKLGMKYREDNGHDDNIAF